MPTDEILRNVRLRGPETSPVVALTFDDGPNGRCTEATLDALAAVGAPATFFVLGCNVTTTAHDELLARMLRDGHRIGLHGWGHGLRQCTQQYAAADLARGALAIRTSLSRSGIAAEQNGKLLFRPPFGVVTNELARAAREGGYPIVLWSISVGDWRSDVSPETITARILETVGAGDVIVLHDGATERQRSAKACVDRANAAAVVRLLVPALRAKGLQPAPLSVVLGLTE